MIVNARITITTKGLDGTREEYRVWIEAYGDAKYGESVEEVLGIVDSLEVGEAELMGMVKAFRLASIYEYMFWDSAYRMEQWPIDPEASL